MCFLLKGSTVNQSSTSFTWGMCERSMVAGAPRVHCRHIGGLADLQWNRTVFHTHARRERACARPDDSTIELAVQLAFFSFSCPESFFLFFGELPGWLRSQSSTSITRCFSHLCRPLLEFWKLKNHLHSTYTSFTFDSGFMFRVGSI